MTDLSFDDLRQARSELKDAVASRDTSLLWFKYRKQAWFIRQATERPDPLDKSRPAAIAHLSSSATCFESLHTPSETSDRRYAGDVATFATRALTLPLQKWQSENAAHIYCRVRTLAPILSLAAEDVLQAHKKIIQKLADEVWDMLDPWDKDRQGIAERPAADGPVRRQAYPPNAFHTYWAIRLLEEWNVNRSVL